MMNIGPSELNWCETPFVCGTDVCRDLREYGSIEMRRLHALDNDAEHQFVDLSYVTASCSLSEARLNFLCSNFYLDMCRTNFSKGLYEEVRTVRAADDDFDPHFDFFGSPIADDDAYGYLDEDAALHALGHIVVAYISQNSNDNETPSSELVWNASVDWRKWAGVRELCAKLPPACTFRSIAFYREISGTSPYAFLLLIEVNRVMRNDIAVRQCVSNVHLVQPDTYAALYHAVDFEIDVEALQTLVCVSRSVQCVGPYLRVDFWRNADNTNNQPPAKTSTTIYGRSDVESRDLDADMKVIENSKKYSLGLLPKRSRQFRDDNNNNNNNNQDSDNNHKAVKCKADAPKAMPKPKNSRSIKHSWQTVKCLLKLTAKEEESTSQHLPTKMDRKSKKYELKKNNNKGNIECVETTNFDDNNNNIIKNAIWQNADDKKMAAGTSEQKVVGRPNCRKTLQLLQQQKREQLRTVDITQQLAGYEMFARPRRKLGAFWPWTRRKNTATA